MTVTIAPIPFGARRPGSVPVCGQVNAFRGRPAVPSGRNPVREAPAGYAAVPRCGILASAARIDSPLFPVIMKGESGMTTPDANPTDGTAATSTPGDEPGDIARYLLGEFGPHEAYREAAREGYLAQNEGRFYELSIWREVKAILREAR